MSTFSEHFGHTFRQAELDFVDIEIGYDLPLYFDPYSFSLHDDPFSRMCHDRIYSFFEELVSNIRSGDKENSLRLLSHLREPNETCLGLSKGKPKGHAIGPKLARTLYDNLRNSRAIKTGQVSDLAEFELFIRGIGPDIISDITTNVIRDVLIRYTQQQCNLIGDIPLQRVPAGDVWLPERKSWLAKFDELPVVNGKKNTTCAQSGS